MLVSYILIYEYYMMFQMYLYYIIIYIYIHYNYIWNPPISFPNFETCVGNWNRWNRGQRQRRTGRKHQGSRNPITAPQIQLCSVETFWICQTLVEENGITHLWGGFFSTYRFVLCVFFKRVFVLNHPFMGWKWVKCEILAGSETWESPSKPSHAWNQPPSEPLLSDV